MKAKLLLHERQQVKPTAFVEVKIWQVPKSVKGSSHLFKYSLAYIVNGTCVLRYDNEAGKGDHKHISNSEYAYAFSTTEQLVKDFWIDVDKWGSK
jgi:hypothetical protein